MQLDTLRLAGDIPLDRLAAVRSDIADRLARGRLSIDTANLEAASLPLVQILHAAHLTARSRGTSLSVSCPEGGTLAKALASFGFLLAARNAPHIVDGAWIGLQSR